MQETETMTIRLDAKDKAMLARLANETNRSKSYLAAQAIRAYVEQESQIIAHIHEGLADMRAGQLVTNASVHKRAMKAIEKAARNKV